MKLKYLYFALPSLLIIAANIYWGSVISWFLSIAIIACLSFFAARLGLEDMINSILSSFKKDDERLGKLQIVNNKWKAILNFSLMTLIFISAVFAVVKTTNPSGKAWFLNIDYHSLSNKGISFDNELTFYTEKPEKPSALSAVNIKNQGKNQALLSFDHCFKPVVSFGKKGKQRQLNAIFNEKLNSGFSINNEKNNLEIKIEDQKPNALVRLLGLGKEKLKYKIKIQSTDDELLMQFNVKPPFTDEITLEDQALENGMSLFNLFLNNESFSAQKNESYPILEAILLELGNTYLLVDNSADYELRLFPDLLFFQNHYHLKVNGKESNPKLENKATVAFGEHFYIGFNNYKQLLSLEEVNGKDYQIGKEKTTALLFDFPNMYMLKSPGEQQNGSKNIRFITTDFDKIISDDLNEGFYFTNYNLSLNSKINGSIDYVSGKANTPLQAQVTDNLKGNTHHPIIGNKFNLSTDNSSVRYLFELRDFSKGGFSYDKIIIYLSCTYFLFLLLCVFYPGRKIDRLEPIILSVIFALLTLRYLLYWRLATFPPLENISKHELESTLRNFDFNLGIALPVPLTLIWTALFVGALILFRIKTEKARDFKIFLSLENRLDSVQKIIKTYGIFILTCLIVFFANKKILHIEMITRIVSIIIPLLAYCYFSVLANRRFEYQSMPIQNEKSKFLIQAKAYVFYLFNNPTFLLTIITLAFFAVADRGFAILFALFILLKNIFVNFLKKPLNTQHSSLGKMLYKPNNYWVFGIISLAAYLVILAIKPLFYYLLTHKLLVILLTFAIAFIILFVIFPQKKKARKILLGAFIFYGILMLIPATNHFMDNYLNNIVKHVQYRASIIHQPLGDLLQQNEYTSFKTKKIIETAENQWFINSYIDKAYDNSATFNLRPFSKIGVDYPTQTRDVMVARFLISELGNFTMYLILLLTLLPLVLYLISYKIILISGNKSAADAQQNISSYAGLIPLIMFFTLALFVWLTSTNRFVFFGQDFPFLSLTSKLSVLLPLLLLGFTLMQTPTLQQSNKINLRGNAIKYLFFIGLIAVFALTTVQKNELNNKNFTIVMETTKTHIDVDLNSILSNIQDSLESKNKGYSYAQLIQILKNDHNFISLKDDVVKDPYTKSILERLVEKPSTALQLNNPLFMIYDNGRYQSVYNKNLYLELPPVENRKIWNGKIKENIAVNEQAQAYLKLGNREQNVPLPFYDVDNQTGLQLAILPASWFKNATEPIGILAMKNNKSDQLFIYKNKSKVMNPTSMAFAQSLDNEDFATFYKGPQTYNVSFQGTGRSFAFNKWINGRYKIIYPLKESNFWIYNYANSIKSIYSNDSNRTDNERISLDYDLGKAVQSNIQIACIPLSENNRRYNFSVIAADGNGNIRLLNDFVSNRQTLDPNDENAIFALQQQQFFFSNARNERDQWGNRNLLNLYLGPGSSIKPLFAGIIASQVNAGWENLLLSPTGVAELENYAGLKLQRKWKNDEHYGGSDFGLAKYIEFSSNYYQSLMLFLGSYPKSDFFKNERYSLSNILVSNSGSNNSFPLLSINGNRYYLPNYNNRNGNWPKTNPDAKHATYFGNEQSLIALGFEENGALNTKKTDNPSIDRTNFVRNDLYKKLDRESSGSFLWSFPEQSSFFQSERNFQGIQENFNSGLKTPSLGGYPYQLTPFKMLGMYLSMMNVNNNFHLQINYQPKPYSEWKIDNTWNGSGPFKQFLAQNIFKGMSDVIFGVNGTAKRLSALKSKYPGYYFYAKTGTINEQTSNKKSSRRLLVTISNKDLTQAQNIGNSKTFGFYFAVDNAGDFDWNLLSTIIDQTMTSQSFQYYFKE